MAAPNFMANSIVMELQMLPLQLSGIEDRVGEGNVFTAHLHLVVREEVDD